MSTSPRMMGRRLTGFRLVDIPKDIRERGKTRALRDEDSFVERIRIGLAAEKPSTRVYWIPTEAYERVMLPKNRRKP